ncbi:lipopolysaccharide transport periplasmic protein LptA [Simplicispira lacusdiani]|uniref:lipopolysaccharide transport periplasmic protein LptA n=1 Tax=Simplicispira lacusdiani TaxID=2213010 RepID=UPI000E71EE67|nr:lipopolysaccharide transport periplasmic protein LptA [Simplicispira lacusdiani]
MDILFPPLHGHRRRGGAGARRWLALALLVCVAWGVAGTARAEKADRNKPMNIEADALRHDDLKQTSVFTGRVVMTKGSIVLRGGRLEVRQDADGYQFGVVTADAGQRAFFRQRRDPVAGAPEEFIEGEGEVIEYDGRADSVRFVRRAELRRLRGAVVSDEITGAVIVYNNLTDVFTVDGQKAGTNAAGDAPVGGGRVRAVLSPKEAKPPAAGASEAAPAASTPALRSSTTLGGGAK